MKVGIVSAFWGPAYPTGSGIYAYELAQRMAANGHEVHVYTSQAGTFNGVKYPPSLHLHRLRTYGVMWDMNPLANVLPKLMWDDFDIVHVHSYIFFMSNAAAIAKAMKGFPYILNFHGGLAHQSLGGPCASRVWMKEKVFDRTLGRITVKLADKVLTVTKSDIPLIREAFSVEPEFVPNAVATEQFKMAESSTKTVTYVGKLEKWKGTDDLLRIFEIVHQEVRDARFMVVGNGSLLEKVKKSKLPITIAGFVPHHMMPAVYAESSVCVLPSYMEGAPTTCMESLASGVPCVATNVGDTPEIVKDGVCGYIVGPGEVEDAASSVVELLQSDDTRKRMGVAGRRHVEENFSYGAVMKRMLGIYQDLIEERAS